MTYVNFGGSASGGTHTAGTVYSDGLSLPSGNQMQDGTTRALIYAVMLYVNGNGGNRVGTIQIGAAVSDAVTATAAGDSTTGTAFANISLSVNGGTTRVQWNGPSFTSWIGHGGAGSVIGGFGTRSGMLGGSYAWAGAPSAPSSLSASPASGTSVALTWVTPSNNGDSTITGYQIQWATNAGFTTGLGSKDVGVVTSDTVTGLTPGATYYFRVVADNGITAYYGSHSASSNITPGVTLGTAPGAPASVVLTASSGLATLTWAAPATDGGVAITGYKIEYDTSAGFTAPVIINAGSAARSYTALGLTPGTGYYFRVSAINGVGTGASTASTPASVVVPLRTALDAIRAASTDVDDMQVSIRSDGASVPTLTLGYTPFGTGTAFTAIGVVPTGTTSGTLAVPGGIRNIELVADPAGNLYLIGTDGADSTKVRVIRYGRTGSATWAQDATLSQSLPSTGDSLIQFAAAYVPGQGVAPVPTIFMLARRAGEIKAGNLSYATLNLDTLAASSGALFLGYGSDPAWLGTPPAGAAPNSGLLDVDTVAPGSTRLALIANGFAVIDVTNGVVAGVSKAANGTSLTGAWARVIGINANTFAVLSIVSGALSWSFYGTNGVLLGSGSYAGANAQGGAFGAQWDAYADRVAGLVTVYYVADDAGARVLESIDVSPVTYASTAAVNITSALGPASSTNVAVRVPQGAVDERRVVIEAANLLAGANSTAVVVDVTGNLAPTAPTSGDVTGFDATTARDLAWTFTDPNGRDAQTAYEIQVQRVSDSVNVVATGKTASAAAIYTIIAGTLANGVNYRWRARTWDKLDTAGAWAAYDAFTTSALGTLAVTSPPIDNPAGLDSSSVPITWAYTQADGYAQTQRRVRVLNTATSAVISDTTMQASTATSTTISGLVSDEQVTVELSIVTNAPGSPTVTTTRKLTPSFASAVTPLLTIGLGASYVTLTVTNPAPTGSRPEVIRNEIDKRPAGSTSPWLHIATVPHNGAHLDHAVKSGAAYDYRVRGIA